MGDNEIKLSAWTTDFLRALYERPWWARIILKFVFGKYAYREFIGMVDTTTTLFYRIDTGYDLEGAGYNQETAPCSNWWKRGTQNGG